MKNPNAVALGSIKTAKKAKASRENGKKGGAPKKVKTHTSPYDEKGDGHGNGHW